MTLVTEFDRSKFKGFKFDFICDGLLTIQKNSKDAIKWYKSYQGCEPKLVVQVSKYPSHEQ